MDEDLPGPDEIFSTIMKETIQSTSPATRYREEVMHTVNFILIGHLINLGQDEKAYPQVRAIVNDRLNKLKLWLEKQSAKEYNNIYRQAYIKMINEKKVTFLEDLPPIPPGAPIGMGCMAY